MGDGGRLALVRGRDCTPETAQTAGMRRLAAISGSTVGAGAIWMGQALVPARTGSGPHHHGHSETAIYVVSGHPVFVFKEEGREVRLAAEPGDYVYVPPFVPHVESNLDSDQEAVVVIARTTQEAIVENLDRL